CMVRKYRNEPQDTAALWTTRGRRHGHHDHGQYGGDLGTACLGLRPLAGFFPPFCRRVSPPRHGVRVYAKGGGKTRQTRQTPRPTPGAPLRGWLQPFIHAYGLMGHHEGSYMTLVMGVG